MSFLSPPIASVSTAYSKLHLEIEELTQKNRALEAKNAELQETIRKIKRNYTARIADTDAEIRQLREGLQRVQNPVNIVMAEKQAGVVSDCLSGAAIGAVVATIVTLPLSIFIVKACP